MAGENDLILRITSEADLSSANLQLRELSQNAKALEEQMKELSKQEEEDVNRLKNLGMSYDKTSENYRRLRKEKQAEIDANNRSIEALKKEVKAYNAVNGAGQKMAMQLRQMREQLMRMEEAGDNSSDAFIELSIQAARLQDQMGDTQQRIRYLASDTKNLDAAMSLGSGLAGAFNTATSASELLGGEMEGLQKAFYKVQAMLSVLNGVQEIANTLNKDSAFRVVAAANAKKFFTHETKLETAAQSAANAMSEKAAAASTAQAIGYKALALATGGASKAMKIFRIALASTGIGLIVVAIAGLIAYFDQLNDQLGVSDEAWGKFKQAAMGALEVVKGTLANIGEGLVKAFHGDFKGALEAFKQVADVSSKYEKGVAKEAAAQAIKVTNELYDLAASANAKAQARYSKSLQDGLRMLTLAQNKAKSDAQERHASEVEMAQQELKFAQQRAEITENANAKAIAANNKEVDAAKKLMQSKQKALNAEKAGTQQYLDALNEFNSAQDNYFNAVQKSTELQQAIDDANQEVIDSELNLRNAVEAQQTELINAKINIMKAGRDKEIAEIEEGYRVQLQSLQGEGEQEVELRKAIEEKKRLEIATIEDKYNDQSENTELQHQLELARMEDKAGMSPKKKIESLKRIFEAEEAIRQKKAEAIERDYELGRISQEDYNDQILQLDRERAEAEIELNTNVMDNITGAFEKALGIMQDASKVVFDVLSSNVQAELDALDENYTTDAEEAKKNSNKKLITQEEYERKKAELEMKQAKYAKAQALTDIGIQTALSIMSTLAQVGATPWGIAMAAIAGAMGAAQFAAAAAKPLAQYAKGRNGGEGEYALVGEKGPEIMYVPKGASIIPNNKIGDQDSWGDYGVPKLNVPEMPNVYNDYVASADPRVSLSVDYDKLGEAVARNIPQNKTVNVSVDKRGIMVSDGHDTHLIMNKKFVGSWR